MRISAIFRYLMPILVGALLIIGIYIFLTLPLTRELLLCDFLTYKRALFGNTADFYYPYWFLIFFYPFGHIYQPIAIVLFWVLSLVSLYFASNIFGGRFIAILLTFQFICAFVVGQVTFILLGGLAFLYWSLQHKRYYLAGLGLTIALVKPQTGLPLALAILLLNDTTWRLRFKVLVVPLMFAALSFVAFPGWPKQLLLDFIMKPPDNILSITLWQYIGPAILILWLPAILLKLPLRTRLILVAATTILTMPYFQQDDLMLLFVMPIGWLPILGNIGFLIYPFGNYIIKYLAIIPLGIYVYLLVRSLTQYFTTRLRTIHNS